MFNKLFAVCLLVEDFDVSLKFYTEKLGLKLNSKNDTFADFKLASTSLAIFQKSDATAMFDPKYMHRGGGSVLAFQVKDMAASCKELQQKGVQIFEGPKTTAWGQQVAYFQDPDQNIWEISQI